ncbi:MAG: multicopper oxidase domain-containing protein [Terracoccus sp.]
MGQTSFSELREPAGIFDRATEMPRPVRKRPHGPRRELTLEQRATTAVVHPDLPPTPAWTYDGMLPGPVVVVRSGERVNVTHEHNIAGTLPYRHVVVDDDAGGTMNDAGSELPSTDPADLEESGHAAALHAYTVAHLHGAPSGPDSDGWAENVIGLGEERHDEYEFPRESWPMTDHDGTTSSAYRSGAAPMYWYHDHGMSVTRLNVYAGLAGAWLVRDPIEAHLGLPVDEEREIPLVLADRNFDTADGTAEGPLTGDFLHKVQRGVREAFAPVNLVNGLAWPRCRVSRKVHRLRILNGSNARTYRLHFHAQTGLGDSPGSPLPASAVQQIGTDGGLLGEAVDLPGGALILSPGERADVLVDFGVLGPEVEHVVVWNSAPAPWGGGALTGSVGDPDVTGFLVTPQVMRFDLTCGGRHPGLGGRPIAAMPLDPDFRRVPTDHLALPADHGHTVIALLEEEMIVRDDMGMPRTNPDGTVTTHAMLYLHEMVAQPTAQMHGANMYEQLIDAVDPADPTRVLPLSARAGIRLQFPGDPQTYVTVGKRFNDTTMAMAVQGSWHLWKVVNLSPDTHPFHIHLSQFQALSRNLLTVNGAPLDPGQTRDITFTTSTPGVLDANEQGWKDTFRVNPGDRDSDDHVTTAEMVTVMGCLASHAGRYMYHCHILEHEDTEMMRPFIVTPSDLMAFMGGHRH